MQFGRIAVNKGDVIDLIDRRRVFDGSYTVREIARVPALDGGKPSFVFHLHAVEEEANEAIYRRLVLDGTWMAPMLRRVNGKSIEELKHTNQYTEDD